VLGSAATCLSGGFGGVEGRALRTGDRLSARGNPDGPIAGARWPLDTPAEARDAPIRILPGPHAARFGRAALQQLLGTSWIVGGASDRMGLRLDGEPIVGSDADAAAIVSLPVTWGAVQLTPGGQPIVLLADHQTVGGYPVIAVVCSADLGRLGQLVPGASLRFASTDHDAAVAALRARQRVFEEAAATLHRPDAWDRLVGSAAG